MRPTLPIPIMPSTLTLDITGFDIPLPQKEGQRYDKDDG